MAIEDRTMSNDYQAQDYIRVYGYRIPHAGEGRFVLWGNLNVTKKEANDAVHNAVISGKLRPFPKEPIMDNVASGRVRWNDKPVYTND